MKNQKKMVDAAVRIAESFHYDKEHSHQVASVALMLFDEFKTLHRLGDRERLMLNLGGILHDIGWVKGQIKHHKTSQDLILSSTIPGISDIERTMIALIARYHRKALPKDTHPYYCDLDSDGRSLVSALSAFIRVADGLDRTHFSAVRQLKASISTKKITLNIMGEYSDIDHMVGKKKSDLMELVFGRQVQINWPE